MRLSGSSAVAGVLLLAPAAALLRITESEVQYSLENDDLFVAINKTNGQMGELALRGHDLVGSGRGPYLDCHCVPEGIWTPGASTVAKFQFIEDVGTLKPLMFLSFLREDEMGLHLFTRATYHSESTSGYRGPTHHVPTSKFSIDSYLWQQGQIGTSPIPPEPRSRTP
ncbi:hypothetical protein BDV12DRAFT_202691 [Aspergillus spectabilis]